MTPVMAQAKTIAKLLDLPVSTFHQYVRAGLLPPGVKIGKHRLWRTETVLAAVDGLGGRVYSSTDDQEAHAASRGSPAHRKASQGRAAEDQVLLEPRSGNDGCGGEGAPARRSIFAGVLGRT